MELSAGAERRARYLAPGSDQCEGLLIPASCCKQSDAACEFSTESECDAAVSESDDSSGSVIIPAAIQLSSVGDDLGTVLAAQTTVPGMAAANAAVKDLWVRFHQYAAPTGAVCDSRLPIFLYMQLAMLLASRSHV